MSDVPHDPYGSPSPPPIPPEVTDVEPMLSSDVKNIAMLCHLLALTGYFTAVGHIVGPLIIWLIKKDDHPFIDQAGKEALNFQISMTIYIVLASFAICIGIGIILIPVLLIIDAVFTIIAALKTANGEVYQYPMAIRFLK